MATQLKQIQGQASANPPGWSYNPSSHHHRNVAFALSGICFLLALYMAIYQLGLISSIWDPIFGNGTRTVLTSKLSKSFPIPDALLATLFYFLDLILLKTGDDRRWNTAPYLTFFSGLVTLGLAAGSTLLLFMQPIVVGAWCTPCILIFFLVLFALQWVLPELLAASYSLFFKSDQSPNRRLASSPIETKGVDCLWTLVVCVNLGILTLFLPDVFNIHGVAKGSIYASGILAISLSIVSMSQIARTLRFGNWVPATLLFCWFLGRPESSARWIAAGIGLALFLLPLYRGTVTESFGIFSRARKIE